MDNRRDAMHKSMDSPLTDGLPTVNNLPASCLLLTNSLPTDLRTASPAAKGI